MSADLSWEMPLAVTEAEIEERHVHQLDPTLIVFPKPKALNLIYIKRARLPGNE